MQRKRFFQNTDRIIFLMSAFCIGLIALLWFSVVKRLNADRNKTIATAVQRNSNLAVALEQYAIRTVTNADAMLQLVRAMFLKNRDSDSFDDLFKKENIDLSYFNGVMILDANGKLLLSNLGADTTRNPGYADRSYFMFHATHDTDVLHMSEPIVSRKIGKAVIFITRRIPNADRSFGGVVGVQIEPATFTKFYSSANLRKYELMSLISPAGITYARRTGAIESYGEDIKASPLFKYVAQNPTGSYFAKDAIRNIRTYFSYRKLENYPIIATVGTAESDVLAEYYEREKNQYFFAILMTGLLICFTLAIIYTFLQRKDSIKKLLASSARYRSIFENSLDAILLLKRDGSIVEMNDAATGIFNVSNDKPRTERFQNLYNRSIPEIDLSSAPAVLQSQKMEIAFTSHAGNTFDASVSISGYKDESETDHVVLIISDISERKIMAAQILADQKKYQQDMTTEIINAQEKERELIGRELHDNVNQILTSAKLYLEMALKQPDANEKLIANSVELILDCIKEIRMLSRVLSAPESGNESLTASVSILVRLVQASSGVHINFRHSTYMKELSKESRLAIYRMMQEQLNNIVKHANATEVEIELSQDADKTKIVIIDNGKGFDTTKKYTGIGLNNILNRTKVLEGQLTIDSAEGKGCRMEIVLPM